MPWAVVGAVGGALISANAAGDASDAQVGAADRGVAEQRRQFDKVQEMLLPFVNAATGGGYAGGGGGGGGGYAGGAPVAIESADSIRQRLLPQFSSGGDSEYGFMRRRTDENGLNQAVEAELARQRAAAASQQPAQAPGAGNGQQPMGALPAYLNLTGLGGADAQRTAIEGIRSGPQFGALTQQGEDAILQNASATGGLRGGNVQGSLANFRSNLLSSLIDKQLSRYGGIVQLGQGSAAGVGNAAMATGQGVAGLMQQGGAAEAGGALASGNAFANALGSVGGFMAGRGNTAPPAATGYGGAGPSGGGGFGSGVVYGNQDLGQYF